jgi:hypothetical protein
MVFLFGPLNRCGEGVALILPHLLDYYKLRLINGLIVRKGGPREPRQKKLQNGDSVEMSDGGALCYC